MKYGVFLFCLDGCCVFCCEGKSNGVAKERFDNSPAEEETHTCSQISSSRDELRNIDPRDVDKKAVIVAGQTLLKIGDQQEVENLVSEYYKVDHLLRMSSSSGLNPNVLGVAGADLSPPLASVPCLTFTDSSLFHVFLYTVFPSSSWPTSLLSSHLHSSYPLTHIFITSSHYMSKPPQSSLLHLFCDVPYFHNLSYFVIPNLVLPCKSK